MKSEYLECMWTHAMTRTPAGKHCLRPEANNARASVLRGSRFTDVAVWPAVLEEEGGQANGRSSPGSTAAGAISTSCTKHRHTNAPAADTPGPARAAHQLGRQLLCQAGTQVPQSEHTPARAGMSHLGSTGKVTTRRNRSLESSADVATFPLAGRYQWSWQGGEKAHSAHNTAYAPKTKWQLPPLHSLHPSRARLL